MLIGQKVGPFAIQKELGSGAMGTVYLASFTKEKDGKVIPVALKVVSLGLLGNDGAMARFDREAAILKQLRHPHIVRLLATGKYRGQPFIAMEYVDGEPLDRRLARRGRLGWEEVCGYAKQLCDALQHAHEQGIIHRDLKPSNLMITNDGVMKLTDFGIAKDADVTALTGLNTTIGTAAYMSPEQCRGDRTLGPKSDLYSLGVVLYELLTGKKPFIAENSVEMFLKHVGETAVRPSRLVPDLPVWVDNLVMFLLEKDRDRRPLDAATVARMIADIESKVENQQSAGAELANARKTDRAAESKTLDAADKEAAKSLRAGGKKKKKKKKADAGFDTGKLLKATTLVVALLAIGTVVYLLTRPASLDDAYAAAVAAPADQKAEALAKFLSAHGGSSNEKVAKVRDEFKGLKVKEVEAQLAKRHRTGIKTAEPFDPDSYQAAMLAHDAEKAGELGRAVELWEAAKGRGPEVADLADADAVARAALGWIADKRAKQIKDEVPATLAKLRKLIADEQAYETGKTYEPTDPTGLAIRALRLDAFGDKPKARVAWDALVAQTEKEIDHRTLYLFAGQQAAKTPAGKPDEAKAAREKLVAAAAAKLTAAATAAGPDDRVARRAVRNMARDIIQLYDDESAEPLKAAVAAAKKVLDATK